MSTGPQGPTRYEYKQECVVEAVKQKIEEASEQDFS